MHTPYTQQQLNLQHAQALATPDSHVSVLRKAAGHPDSAQISVRWHRDQLSDKRRSQ